MNNAIITRNDGTWYVIKNAGTYTIWSQIIEDLYELGAIVDRTYHKMIIDLNSGNHFHHIRQNFTEDIRNVVEAAMVQFRQRTLTSGQYIRILNDVISRVEKKGNIENDYKNYDRAMKGV